ncbi:MAG: ATP-binding protein [Phycisphaerae bacterium]|nr:ATP-binding protein [Phycisphaerae bacterium]
MNKEFTRDCVQKIIQRLSEPRRFLQVLIGPRQVGKTTIARQAVKLSGLAAHFVSADEPTLQDRSWLRQQWDMARVQAASSAFLLVIDEIQKVTGWSETVKKFWDEDSQNNRDLRVMLLGSSPWLVQKGLSESLAGRFEILPVTHWSYSEMRQAFGLSLDQYLYFGGYPGAASLINDPDRWASYINQSLIETTLSRDIFLHSRIDKPALLRRLFHLACTYSGQILSYQKMVGQLQDAGNTTTLAHYLELLAGAGLVVGLHKYCGQKIRQKSSSPKLLVLNNALTTALSGHPFEEWRQDGKQWGRLVESAVGAHLYNGIQSKPDELFYWNKQDREVDFIIRHGDRLTAFEVSCGFRIDERSGIDDLSRSFPIHRRLRVGAGGIPLDEFLMGSPNDWLK